MNQHPPNEGKIDTVRYSKYMAIVVGALALTNPIQLVKTRMQTSPQHLNKGSIKEPYEFIAETTKRIVNEEGAKGLWKGVGYFIMRTVPASVGVFTLKQIIHNKLTRFVHSKNHQGHSRLLKQFLEKHFFLVNSFIGGFAGLAIQVMIYPFQYFRIQISNQIKKQSDTGILKCIRQTIHHKGILGIFNGVTMNLIYMVAARGLYFGIFDSFKDKMPNQHVRYVWSYISISISLLVNYPLDTIRKRVVLSPKRFKNGRECFLHVFKHERLTDFYSGWRTVSLQSISYATLFYLYDKMFTQMFRSR